MALILMHEAQTALDGETSRVIMTSIIRCCI